MGFYGNATVFAQEPDWKGLEELPFAIRAYRHKRKPVWVVAVFEYDGTNPESVFFEEVPVQWARKTAAQRLPPDVRSVLNRLTEVRRVMGRYSYFLGDCLNYLTFAAAIARRAQAPAYFFAANDESTDLGCLAAPERFERFAFGCEHFVVEYRDGIVTLAQRDAVDPEDADDLDPEELEEAQDAAAGVAERLARCAEIEGVALRPLTKEDRRRLDHFYGFAGDLWPAEMAPAKKALKIGTWDPFDYPEKDLQVVADRMSNEPSPLVIRPIDKRPARPRGMKPEKLGLSRRPQDFRFRHGDLLIFSDQTTGGSETLFLDTRGWPLAVDRLGEYVVAIDRSRGGRWATRTELSAARQLGRHWVAPHEVRLRDDPFSGEFSVLACGGPNPELEPVMHFGMRNRRIFGFLGSDLRHLRRFHGSRSHKTLCFSM